MSKRRDTGFPVDVRELITARSGSHCEVMATGCTLMGEQFHHRRPRGAGGTNRPDTNLASNALHVCQRCHLRIESFRTWARAHGFILNQSSHPEAQPVWWRCNQTVLLDNAGNRIPVVSQDAG